MIPRGRGAVLAFSPHLDDAVLSAGASVSAAADAGGQVIVCTVFAGVPDTPCSPIADHFHGLAGLGPDAVTLRRREDLAALEVLGAKAVHLDFLDVIYRRHDNGWLCRDEEDPFRLGLPPEPELLGWITHDIRKLIETVRPDAVWTCAAIGEHVDHRLTRDATLAAAGRDRPVLLWEDVPYAYRHPGGPPSGAEVSAGVMAATRTMAKLEAIACYPSQIRALWPAGDWRHEIIAESRARESSGGGPERFWLSRRTG